MSNYYDENFGHWKDMNDPEMVEFYHKVQRESVLKVCARCEEKVRIRPQYSICGPCADEIEGGYGF